MVPLDIALLSSCRLSAVPIPLFLMVWHQFSMQVLTWGLIQQISASCGGPGLGPARCTDRLFCVLYFWSYESVQNRQANRQVGGLEQYGCLLGRLHNKDFMK